MNNNLFDNNVAHIAGRVSSDFEFFSSAKKEKFYKVTIDVERHSGEVDTLPVIISEKLLTEDLMSKPFLKIDGQIRTHNSVDGMQTHLFARLVTDNPFETFTNVIYLDGFMCKKGNFRVTNSDRKIYHFILAVNRVFNKSDYIPIVTWGKDAIFSHNKEVGTNFKIMARFQSRTYSKKNEKSKKMYHTTYELSVKEIEEIQ